MPLTCAHSYYGGRPRIVSGPARRNRPEHSAVPSRLFQLANARSMWFDGGKHLVELRMHREPN
jgi:hypothetical protein